MATASLHVKPQKTFSADQANENERCWSESQYIMKNAQSGNHYDWSRRSLNFEVVRSEDGSLSFNPLNSPNRERLNVRLQKRLEELGFKSYKKDARNDPNSCIDIVIGGSHDRMSQMAFGSQEVAFNLSRDNSHIKREHEIENWAKDVYEFACAKWGAANVIGMEVHLDETTPHAHLLIVPTAIRKQRGRVKPGTERKEKTLVSYCGLFGETNGARSKYLSQLHTEFHEKVGHKYGLERGECKDNLSPEEQDARVHKNKHQLEAERRSKQRVAALKDKDAQLSQAIEGKTILKMRLEGAKEGAADLFTGKSKKEIKRKEEEIKTLQETIQDKDSRIQELQTDVQKANEKNKQLETLNTLIVRKNQALSKALETLREDQAIIKNIGDNLDIVFPQATALGLNAKQAIVLAAGMELDVKKLHHDGKSFSLKDNLPIHLRFYAKKIEAFLGTKWHQLKDWFTAASQSQYCVIHGKQGNENALHTDNGRKGNTTSMKL